MKGIGSDSKSEKQIEEALRILNDATERIENNISELVERITPILSIDKTDDDGNKDCEQRCSLATDISSIRERIEVRNNILRSVINRIEL